MHSPHIRQAARPLAPPQRAAHKLSARRLQLAAPRAARRLSRCMQLQAQASPIQPPQARSRSLPLLPPGKKQKQSIGAKILSGVLGLSSAPYSSYVPEPKTYLHYASAEAKQLWTVAALLIMARASPPVRLAIAAALVGATVTALPRRLWQPQLVRLGGLCAVLFFFTLIGAEGVPPVLNDRSLPAAAAAAGSAAGAAAASTAAAAATSTAAAATSAAASTAATAAVVELPASMAQLGGPQYRYVLFHFWFITITKRSLNLAAALTGLTFAALQSASLCLVTTPPEAMARAVGRALRPLGLLGVPVRELVLTMLLALRFMATAFEEARNLCLGLAARGIDWQQQGLRGTLAVCVGMGSKLFANLMARCDNIAVAMTARGFQGPARHVLRDAAPPLPPRERALRVAADAALLLTLGGLAAASWACV